MTNDSAMGITSDIKQFSIYNVHSDGTQKHETPLQFLLPRDSEHGWHVARNWLKPLNHLDFLRDKEDTAVKLNLHSNITPPSLFDLNYQMLADHQTGEVSTSFVIDQLVDQLHRLGEKVSEVAVRKMLREYATIRHMEFHPSDVCNLTCKGCTYGHDIPKLKPPPINFPIDEIKKIAQLQPRSMVIVGGGEPTLYRSNGFRYQEMVEEVRRWNRDIKLALITNGTYRPDGDWPNWFSWIRISLDAATQETYLNFRGKPMFDRVIQNYLAYLDFDVPYVGISFLFSKANIHEYAAVARLIYRLVKEEKPWALPKVNIQYRPLRRDPYQYSKPLKEAISHEQIASVIEEVWDLAESSTEMKEFLRNQTNISAVLGGNSHPPHEFSRCYYGQTFRIVRANGDLRPCFIRVMEPNFVLGNIIADSLEAIALNTLYVGARRMPHCDPYGCRQCHVNYTFEHGLRGSLKPSRSPSVLADPMY